MIKKMSIRQAIQHAINMAKYDKSSTWSKLK